MKPLYLPLLILALGCAQPNRVFAQSVPGESTTAIPVEDSEGFVVLNGKTYIVKGGKASPLDRDMNVKDLKVSPNDIKNADGTVKEVPENSMLTMDGRVIGAPAGLSYSAVSIRTIDNSQGSTPATMPTAGNAVDERSAPRPVTGENVSSLAPTPPQSSSASQSGTNVSGNTQGSIPMDGSQTNNPNSYPTTSTPLDQNASAADRDRLNNGGFPLNTGVVVPNEAGVIPNNLSNTQVPQNSNMNGQNMGNQNGNANSQAGNVNNQNANGTTTNGQNAPVNATNQPQNGTNSNVNGTTNNGQNSSMNNQPSGSTNNPNATSTSSGNTNNPNATSTSGNARSGTGPESRPNSSNTPQTGTNSGNNSGSSGSSSSGSSSSGSSSSGGSSGGGGAR